MPQSLLQQILQMQRASWLRGSLGGDHRSLSTTSRTIPSCALHCSLEFQRWTLMKCLAFERSLRVMAPSGTNGPYYCDRWRRMRQAPIRLPLAFFRRSHSQQQSQAPRSRGRGTALCSAPRSNSYTARSWGLLPLVRQSHFFSPSVFLAAPCKHRSR